MNVIELLSESNESTYCPQDNKLRLYVGRVSKEEYLALRGEGWKSTPKQDCDFVATWTPEREDTCFSYSGVIGDEDQSPQERAIDRAERFAGYRDNRTSEAMGFADQYENKDRVHGYQNQEKAERAARKHDRLGDKAVNQWSKAEYWTTRTAGVISNALYKDLPAVRMTRIKEIEKIARRTADRTDERGQRWNAHCELRLAYERQMIEAQGGMAEDLDIKAGGLFAGKLIHGVTRSQATKRVSSVKIMYSSFCHKADGMVTSLQSVKIERFKKDAYTPPTDETLQQLADIKKAEKEAKKLLPKKPSLINPTIKEAQKMQDILNSRQPEEAQEILIVSQEWYAERSKGTYARLGTKFLCGGVKIYSSHWNAVNTDPVCKVRMAPGISSKLGYLKNVPDRIIVIEDKPQKKMPAPLWVDPAIEYLEECKANAETIIRSAGAAFLSDVEICPKLWEKARICRLVSQQSQSQKQLTDYGNQILSPLRNERV